MVTAVVTINALDDGFAAMRSPGSIRTVALLGEGLAA